MAQLYELEISDYIDIVRKRKWLVLIIFSLIFAINVINANMQTYKYNSALIFKIKMDQGSASTFIYKDRPTQRPQALIADYEKQIVSKPIVKAALKEMGGLSEDGKPVPTALINGSYLKTVWAGGIKNTNMVKVVTYAYEPQWAADLANNIFKVFKKTNLLEKNKQQRKVTEFIGKELNAIAKKLEIAENRVRILTTQGIVGSAQNLLRQVNELERKRINLLSVYTSNYPDVLALEEEINELKMELRTLPNEEFEYGVLARNIKVDQRLYNSLKIKLQESQIKEAEKKDNLILIDNASPSRKPCYPNKMKYYISGFFLGLVAGVGIAIFIEQVLETSIGRVEDIEHFIKVSVVGIIPFHVHEKKNAKRFDKILSIFSFKKNKPKADEQKEELLAIHAGGSLFVEAFRILATNAQVIFGTDGRISHKAVMITSSNPEEGKSTISSNLAITFAQMGYRVLLVDVDLRKPSIGKMFGIEGKTTGLTDILIGGDKVEEMKDSFIKTATDVMLGTMGVEDIVQKPWMNNLHILMAGSIFPNPVQLLNSERTTETINTLKQCYDLVLIDSPPLFVVSDASILLPRVDGVFLVYRVGTTSRMSLRRAKTQVDTIKGEGAVNGVILNNTLPEITKKSYYYYHKSYHEYGKTK